MKSPRVLISASAGSGKTHRLVLHFLGILYDGLIAPNLDRQPRVVERILAATFTRTAAGEIIDRILKRAAGAMLDPKERADLCAQLEIISLDEADCGKLLQALVSGLHRLRVGTVDSFLVRSAQAFSTELGLPDRWEILDDATDKTVALEAIDQLLLDASDDAPKFNVMVDLLLMLNQGRYALQIRQRLMDHFRETQSALLAGPQEAWEVIAPNSDHLLASDQCESLAMELSIAAHQYLHITKAGAPHSGWVKALAAIVQKAKACEWEELLNGGLVGALGGRPPKYSGGEMRPELIALLMPFRNHAAACLIKLLLDRNRSTCKLLADFVREYRIVKSRRSAYRFDDFSLMLLDANVLEDLGDFYFRLDGAIDHILLDEFQDTSVSQWKLIKPLVDEIMSGQGGASTERSFFCVGDIKQTLYGWRNAEPELLNRLGDEWTDSGLKQEPLLVSRRSSPLIIQSVNQIFGSLARNAALTAGGNAKRFLSEAADEFSGWFQDHSTARPEADSFCRLMTCEDGESAADKQAAAIKLTAERVAELHKTRPDAEIAVLLRRKKFIGPLLGRLRRLDIIASGEGGSPLADDMAVCAVLSLLHLIDHPSDTAAAFHVGSSPLGKGLGFGEILLRDDIDKTRSRVLSKTTELRIEILDRGLGAAINRWLGLFSESCDARNFRRLRRLIELAHGYDYDGGDLRPFIDTVRATNVEDGESSKVQVMTIHASKGRQFDYVILPDLDKKFGGQGAAVLLNRPDILEEADCITIRPSAAQAAVDARLEQLVCDGKRRQVVEELCALYVGLTRAKTGLEMIVHPQIPGKEGNTKLPASSAGVLRGALCDGAAAPSEVLWEHPGSKPVRKQLPESFRAPVALAPVHVRLAPTDGTSRSRPVLTPSALEGFGVINLTNVLRFDRDRGTHWGSIMHRWFEMIEWLDEPLPSDDDLRAKASELGLGISPAQLDLQLDSFHQACAAPGLSKLLCRASYLKPAGVGATLEVWRERSFAARFPMPGMSVDAIVQGRVDRVVIVRNGGKVLAAELVDYKTDVVDRKSVGEKVDYYALQIHAYRKAMASLLRLDESAVSAKIAFVGADLVITVS